MRYTITIQETHYEQLKNHLLKEDGKERVAFIICGRSLVENEEERFLTKELIFLSDEQLLTSEKYQVSWDNNYFIKALKKAETKNFGVIVIHNHPSGFEDFSETDDKGEKDLFKLAFNRNGGDRPHGSLIMMPNGSLIGRIWNKNLNNEPFSLIRVIGNSFKLWYPNRLKKFETPTAFNRQKLAFGSALVQDLSKIKCTIVGAGATGSATALLLTRLGIGELNIIDKDVVEETNLNRLHGAKKEDIGKYKVDVLKKYIIEIGLGTKVNVIKDWISSKKGRDLLKLSDVVFGCTDDHSGRILLNRFAFFYLTPVIDMGLVISVNGNPPSIQDLQGRISYLYPHSDCLITKSIINPDIAYEENLQRNEPDNYEKLKKEAYVIGEGNPAPAVVTFTTQIASMAVNEFLNRMQNFNPLGKRPHKIYFFHRGTEITPANLKNNECRICGSEAYWGRGDIQQFLDMVI